MLAAFIEGGVEMGYPNIDINAVTQTGGNIHIYSIFLNLKTLKCDFPKGFMMIQATQRRGKRCSTAKAFLRPIRHRRNLHISMNSFVLKINIDPITKIANGVQFKKKGVIYNVEATKELILSAGAINSSQILMLSGVDPADHLKSLGIPVKADLRVGDNLQDHVALGGMVFTLDKVLIISFLN